MVPFRFPGNDPLKRRNIHDTLHFWLKKLGQRVLRPAVAWRTTWLFLGATALAVVVTLWLLQTGLAQEAAFMAGIFVLAALLWVTEALPLFATALLVLGLEVLLLGNPGGWTGLGFAQGETPDYRVFLAPLSDPIIILFLGGFLMAQAAIKEGVDKALAALILKLFGGKPLNVMMGMMLITAAFSMWMSNTATTAMMITLVIPMLSQLPPGDRLRKGLVLSVPFAANIGGMGTPIASPPNAVAVAFMNQAGYNIGFLDWVLIALPLMIALLAITWLLLRYLFQSEAQAVELKPESAPINGTGWFVVVVILVTILLWLTDKVHGLPTAVVAMVPAVAFTATGLIGRKDYNSLEWHILMLIAGGIALGFGMQKTGLDQVLVDAMPVGSGSLLAVMVLATWLFSTFMSNTAAANLLLPIGISLALSSGASAMTVMQLGISIALAASVAMALPISTPPNAIAYAHGELETRDLVVAGTLVGLLAITLIMLGGGLVIGFWL